MSPRTDAHFTATATVYNVWPFKNMHTRALLQKPCTMSYGHLDTDTSVSSKAKIIICKYTPGGTNIPSPSLKGYFARASPYISKSFAKQTPQLGMCAKIYATGRPQQKKNT